MTNQFKGMIDTVPPMLWAAAALLLVLVLMVWKWEHVKFFWLRIYYDLPLIGKLSKLKNDNRPGEAEFKGWNKSEETLCSDFYPFYPRHNESSKEGFTKAKDFLRKARLLDREHTPTLLLVVLGVLTIAEAITFGFVLAGFIDMEASQFAIAWLGWVIGIVLAGAMLWLTHSAGKEQFVNKLRTYVRQGYEEHAKDLVVGDLQQIDIDETETDNTCRDEKTGKPEPTPPYIQLARRTDAGKRFQNSWMMTSFTVVIIVAIAVGAFFVRNKLMESLYNQQTVTQPAAGASASSNNIMKLLSSQTLTATQHASRQQIDAKISAAHAAFVILSMIFIIVQVLGIYTGYSFGFGNNQQAKNAARRIHGFDHFSEFQDYYARKWKFVGNIAQAKLSNLQIMTKKEHQQYQPRDYNPTFADYVAKMRKKDRAEVEAEENEISRGRKRSDAGWLDEESSSATNPEIIGSQEQHTLSTSSENKLLAEKERSAPGDQEAEIKKEIREKLQAEKRKKESAVLRREIETRMRREMGLDAPEKE